MDAWTPSAESTALRSIQLASRDAEEAMARRMAMHPTDLAAMAHITTPGAHLGPSDLVDRLGITPAAVTDLVDRLEHAGHVVRERDTADRRRIHLVATEHAVAEVRAQLRSLVQALDSIAQEFDDEERAVITRFLLRTADAYRRFADDD